MSEPIFQTPRLQARPLTPSDTDALFALYGNPDVVRFVGDGRPLSRAQCEEWVEVTQRNYATRGYGMFALVERATGAIVGFCGLVHPGGQVEAEIKYALRPDCWGRGFATEAAIGLLGYAGQLGLRQVIATADPGNQASHRVLLKAGMRWAERRRHEDGSFTQRFEWTPAQAAPVRMSMPPPAQSVEGPI